MATIGIIKEAIAALKDRTGSSVPAINKWIESEKQVSAKSEDIGRSQLQVKQKNIAFFCKNFSTSVFGVGIFVTNYDFQLHPSIPSYYPCKTLSPSRNTDRLVDYP